MILAASLASPEPQTSAVPSVKGSAATASILAISAAFLIKEFFKTWLTRIVINKSKDYLKKQRFTEELTDNLNVFYDMPQDEIGIMDCICKLNSKSSIYITLRFYNDMTYDEVARTLKLPVSTVKYKTKKALNKLKSLLEGDAK